MRYLLILGMISIFVSCAKEESTDDILEITSSSYFPLIPGTIIDYNVSEIIYRQDGIIRDTIEYQLREEVGDPFIDDAGATVHNIDRFTRTNSSSSWQYEESWYAMIEKNQAIRIEENKRYIKLRLPLRSEDSWDGNALFDSSAPVDIGGVSMDYFKNWRSHITSMNQQTNLGDIQIDNVHTVVLSDYENKLELRKGVEVYADGIGLVYKSLEILDTQCFDNCSDQAWEEKAQSGHIYTQTLLK